jgi:hypothetical protein
VNQSSNTKFAIFREQQKQFKIALENHDPNIWFPSLRGNFTEDNPANWFICFVPSSWGRWQGNYGVHFGFIYARERGSLPERIRLPIGVETPMKKSFQQEFKESVISGVTMSAIIQTDFVLQAKARTKLLEIYPIPFGGESWQIAFEQYIALKPVVDLIARVLKEYRNRGAFEVPVEFPT